MNPNPNTDKGLSRGDKTYFLLSGVAIFTVLLWNLPLVGWLQYPFMLLGTWFHEMGHGITAWLVGASFEELLIFANGSGLAVITGRELWVPESLGRVMISLGGLLGPALAGGALIISGRQKSWSRIALILLASVMTVSMIFLVRTFWGILILSLIVLMLGWAVWKGSRRTQQILVQYLGLQASLSTFLQIGYLFTEKVVVGGEELLSDTASIASHSFGNYALWGAMVSVLTLGMIWLSFRLATRERLWIERKSS
ncbi:MAG: M50 family metallopeptidase [Bacteroidota bacterium]